MMGCRYCDAQMLDVGPGWYCPVCRATLGYDPGGWPALRATRRAAPDGELAAAYAVPLTRP